MKMAGYILVIQRWYWVDLEMDIRGDMWEMICYMILLVIFYTVEARLMEKNGRNVNNSISEQNRAMHEQYIYMKDRYIMLDNRNVLINMNYFNRTRVLFPLILSL